jgi:hypothetical protein
MILLTAFFDPKNEQRTHELLECRRRNFECKAFTRVTRFVEDGARTQLDAHITETLVPIPGRMTYGQFFNCANGAFPPGEIVVLANADIWFDDTLLNINEKNLDGNTFFACSRWGYMNEIGGWHWDDGFDKNGAISQDAWIFRVPVRCALPLDFTPGRMRCDNVLAHAMQHSGYRVINPTLPGPRSLKIHHEHKSQTHNYGNEVPGAMILVQPVPLP